jgi:hypothetical protein
MEKIFFFARGKKKGREKVFFICLIKIEINNNNNNNNF